MCCHVTQIKGGPACLNCCPASTTAMKPQFEMCENKFVSGRVPWNQLLVLAHLQSCGSWARGAIKRSGVDPPLSSSRACLHTAFIASPAPF